MAKEKIINFGEGIKVSVELRREEVFIDRKYLREQSLLPHLFKDIKFFRYRAISKILEPKPELSCTSHKIEKIKNANTA